jgi:hypothetical protein
VGRTIEGHVQVDPQALFAAKLAEETADGVRIISNNGATITPKTKLGREPVAVEGLQVRAVSLADGTVLAGPVETDAKGGYKLQMASAPATNYRIDAAIEGQARFNYPVLVAAGIPGEMVTNDDGTRLTYNGLSRVLPERVAPVLQARKAGGSATAVIEAMPFPQVQSALKLLDAALGALAEGKLAELDADGKLLDRLAGRTIAHLDLKAASFVAFRARMDEVLRFERSLPAEKSVADDVAGAAAKLGGGVEVTRVLQEFGMPEAQAQALGDGLGLASRDVALELSSTFEAHTADVLEALR